MSVAYLRPRATAPLPLQVPASAPRFAKLTKRDMPLGTLLVQSGFLDRGTLRIALARRGKSMARIGEVLSRNGLIDPAILADAIALQWHVGRIDLDTAPPDPALAENIDLTACLRIGAIPWRDVDGLPIIAVADPARADEAIIAARLPNALVSVAVAPADQIRRCLETRFADRLAEEAAFASPPEMSCRHWSGAAITRAVAIALSLVILALIAAPVAATWALLGFMLLANVATGIMRLSCFIAGLGDREGCAEIQAATPAPRRPTHEPSGTLPKVSIMVPLHREDLVLPALMRHIEALDYPWELLDIKFLVEADDHITLNAIAANGIEGRADVVRVPKGEPTTKPRALNYGIRFCTGDIIGILDAEDRPERDQIRKLVAFFDKAPPNVAAVQGALDFYNTYRNQMSRCFTLEYNTWFRVLLRGMRKLNLPIPLGGTTVYFRRSALETLGGWDAHNVTEDADLGIRIARAGMVTEMLDTTTWEEANSEIVPWIKQRSRWLKGYLMTWAVHMRAPRALYRDIGFWPFMAFHVTLLGGVMSYLSMPFLWMLWLGYFGFGLTSFLPAPDAVWQSVFWSMIIGQVIMLCVALVAVARSRRWRLLWTVPVLPIYWMLGALATAKALSESLYAPFYWDKTTHGTQSDQDEAGAPVVTRDAFGGGMVRGQS